MNKLSRSSYQSCLKTNQYLITIITNITITIIIILLYITNNITP